MATRAAEAGREEKRAKLRRGERVAPTRATVAEYAPAWLEAQVNLRPRTIEKYRGAIDVHIIPRLGRLRLGDVSEEHIALLVADMQREGYAGWTIRGILTPLGRILGHARSSSPETLIFQRSPRFGRPITVAKAVLAQALRHGFTSSRVSR